jgi:hypothetical protein
MTQKSNSTDTKKLKNKKDTCEITGVKLKSKPELKDVERIVPKSEGGTFNQENILIVKPDARMKAHGIYREREGVYDELKALIDDRNQIIKLIVKINNQILAYKRATDNPSHLSIEILEEASKGPIKRRKDLDKEITHLINKLKKEDRLVKATLGISGVGEITVAHLLSYIDLTIAQHPSSLCSYCGYDKPSHKRYEKGVAGGGNKTLRSVLYNTASSMIKHSTLYAEKIYYPYKERLETSEKITESRNTQGKLIQCMWKDTKAGHRHGAAMRKMIQIFLIHYWIVGRSILEMPTSKPYVEEKLGHTGIITPEEMGWEW